MALVVPWKSRAARNDEEATINVSAVRAVIIPLTSALSPPNANTDARTNNAMRHTRIVFLGIVASDSLSSSIQKEVFARPKPSFRNQPRSGSCLSQLGKSLKRGLDAAPVSVDTN
jgi:hypothetical protein